MRILTALLLLASVAYSDEQVGKVVAISDGDTLTLLTASNEQVKVRLDGIDAPEKGQGFSAKSKAALASKVHGKEVRVVTSGKDRYGRTIGTVYVGEENVNTSSGVRHNSTCASYKNTKRGRACSANEGKACGVCGG